MGIATSGKRVAPTNDEISWWTLQLTLGKTDAEIAKMLGLTAETAKSRTTTLLHAAGFESRNRYVATVTACGLVTFTSWAEAFPNRKKEEPFYQEEIDILELMLQGYRDNEIAQKLSSQRRELERVRRRLAKARGINNRPGCLIADCIFTHQGK